MSAGPPIFFEPQTGNLRLPGRVTRTLIDTQAASPGALPSWWQLAGGTLGSVSWSATNNAPPGSFQATTPATSAFLSGIKGNAPFNVVAPYRLTALGLTVEGLAYDADSGFGTSIGFFATGSSKGGAWLSHDAGTTAAYVATNDATGTKHTYPVQYQFFTNTGSAGQKRRNLTVLWFIHDGWFYVLEDDQVIAAVDISDSVDVSDTVYPALFISSTGATQHFVQWSQTKLIVNHN